MEKRRQKYKIYKDKNSIAIYLIKNNKILLCFVILNSS